MKSKDALEKIKNIGLHHLAYYDDDDGSIDSYEEYDGTIEENYTDEIKVIEKDLELLELIKSKVMPLVSLASAEGIKENYYRIYDAKLCLYSELDEKQYELFQEWLENDNSSI